MRFSISLLTAALIGSCVAAPVVNCPLGKIVFPTEVLANSSNPDMPLPAPSGTLAKIILGVGFQNYSCENGVPKANGAIANLYDASCLAKPDDLVIVSLLPAVSVHADRNCEAMLIQIFQKMLATQFVAGFHYFKGDFATPAFTFNDNTAFYGKLGGKVPALATADKGVVPNANGAVPTLQLVKKDGIVDDKGRKQIYKQIYRIYTAGGNPPASCNWTGQKKIPYAAQYWAFK